MEEIIEKLKKKEKRKEAKEIPEPISARVSREKLIDKRPITPPELDYRSPQILNKFYSKSPEWIHPTHTCAASLEADAHALLMSRYQNYETSRKSILINADLQELEQNREYARNIQNRFEYKNY